MSAGEAYIIGIGITCGGLLKERVVSRFDVGIFMALENVYTVAAAIMGRLGGSEAGWSARLATELTWSPSGMMSAGMNWTERTTDD